MTLGVPTVRSRLNKSIGASGADTRIRPPGPAIADNRAMPERRLRLASSEMPPRRDTGQPRPPWNQQVPGDWHSLRRVADVGSYIGDYVDYRGGCYRLIALADSQAMTPMILNRIAGCDETGTLYIGLGGWRSTVRFRCLRVSAFLRLSGNRRKRLHWLSGIS
jgi:hypothetical protein